MQTLLSNIRLLFLSLIIAISPAQNLLASVNHHGMAQMNASEQAMTAANHVDGQSKSMHCQDHTCHQTECDGVHCVSATFVIFQTPDKLVIPDIKYAFLLQYDSVLIKNYPSRLFRPPRA